jgi:YHS domain-containing protein
MKALLTFAAICLASAGFASAAPVNTTCPVAGKPAKASVTVKHDGKTIAFCCNRCKAKFKANPEKYEDKVD